MLPLKLHHVMYFSIKLQGNRKGKKAVQAATHGASWRTGPQLWERESPSVVLLVVNVCCPLLQRSVLRVTQLFSVFACIAKVECLCMYPCFASQEKKNLSCLISVHQGACSAQSSCQQPHRLLAIKQIPAFSLGTHSWCHQVWPLRWGHVLQSCASQTLAWGPCEPTGRGLVGLGWDMNFCRQQAPK